MRCLRYGLALVTLAAVGGCGLVGGQSDGDQGLKVVTSSPTKAATPEGDARALYLESMRRQAMQPSINLVHEYYSAPQSYPGGTRESVVSGVDYRSKDVRLEKNQLIVAHGKTTLEWTTWCQDKSAMWFYSGPGHWSQTADKCPEGPYAAWLNDGLGVGGLTKDQADVFVKQLGDYKGLITARGKSMVTRNGKEYLRLVIKVTPHSYGGTSPAGADMYMDALKWTEIDLEAQPYFLLPDAAAAMDIVRYVDPETMLPVYSETVEKSDDWHLHRVEYSFGGPVKGRPRPTTPTIAQLTWKPEKR